MMTPALKAMFEAMAAERDRQIADADVEMADELDLEKVARAGLEAAEPILLAEFEADAAEQQRMDDAVAAEWEVVDRDE